MKKLLILILSLLSLGACRPDDPKPEPAKQKQVPTKPNEGQYPFGTKIEKPGE